MADGSLPFPLFLSFYVISYELWKSRQYKMQSTTKELPKNQREKECQYYSATARTAVWF